MIKRVYKLFIGGLASTMAVREVQVFLATLGPIDSVELLAPEPAMLDGRHASRSLPSHGNCVVTVADVSFYHRLMQAKSLTLGERSLIVTPYLAGVDLYKANSANNKKRVILKQVASSVTADELVELLQTCFGEVSHMFAFKSERKETCGSQRAFSSYSVMFANTEAARLAASAGYLETDEISTILIERFEYSKTNKKSKKTNNNSKMLFQCDNSSMVWKVREKSCQSAYDKYCIEGGLNPHSNPCYPQPNQEMNTIEYMHPYIQHQQFNNLSKITIA